MLYGKMSAVMIMMRGFQLSFRVLLGLRNIVRRIDCALSLGFIFIRLTLENYF